MSGVVAVMGGNGRLGSRLVDRARGAGDEVIHLPRVDAGCSAALDDVMRGLGPDDVVVNAAGRAHVAADPSADVCADLRISNVELPLLLAERCLRSRSPLVHLSSVKASSRSTTQYSTSKREAEARLIDDFEHRFDAAGIALVLVRPPAVLAPPFDAGKLSRMRWLSSIPSRVIPPVPVPAISADGFVDRLVDVVRDVRRSSRWSGVRVVEWTRSDWVSLKTVAEAM